jgi:hypothetical protein
MNYLLQAPTNPTNNGCGLSGRDINSGWNWTPSIHGWSLISTISVNWPSGLVPEITNHKSCMRSLYVLLNSYLCLCLSSIDFAPYTFAAKVFGEISHGYVPNLMVPHLVFTLFWCSIIWTTGSLVSGSNSWLLAVCSHKTCLANSIAIIWEPRQIPKYGFCVSLAYWQVMIMPSTHLLPNPPGKQIPSISSRTAVPFFSISSASTKHKRTLRSWWNPATLSHSLRE